MSENSATFEVDLPRECIQEQPSPSFHPLNMKMPRSGDKTCCREPERKSGCIQSLLQADVGLESESGKTSETAATKMWITRKLMEEETSGRGQEEVTGIRGINAELRRR